jgi:hypothetical protein
MSAPTTCNYKKPQARVATQNAFGNPRERLLGVWREFGSSAIWTIGEPAQQSPSVEVWQVLLLGIDGDSPKRSSVLAPLQRSRVPGSF